MKDQTIISSDFQPDAVIHCAAERRPDVVSKNKGATAALNVSATELLVQQALKVTTLDGMKISRYLAQNVVIIVTPIWQ